MTNPSLRLLALVGALVLAAAALIDARPADASSSRIDVLAEITDYRSETWRWQQLMGARRTPSSFDEREAKSAAYRAWLRDLWRRRALAAERRAAKPPHRSAWLCIHRYERHPHQGWATRTGNGFFGGLQMNVAFQRTYGRELLRTKGTADRWSPLEQMWVAERAYRSGRGFYPWPNTARYCGLI